MAADPWHHFQEGPGSKLLCCFKPFVGSLSFNKLLWPINRRLRKDNAHYLQLSGTARNKNTEKIITNSTSWRKQFNQAPRPPLAGDWGVVVKILRRTWREWKIHFYVDSRYYWIIQQLQPLQALWNFDFWRKTMSKYVLYGSNSE